jgi:hypothetical protein
MDADGGRSSSLGDGSGKALIQASVRFDGAATGGPDFMLPELESPDTQPRPHVAGRCLSRPRVSAPLVQDGLLDAVLPATRRSSRIGGGPLVTVPWAPALSGAPAGEVDVGPPVAAGLLVAEATLQARPVLCNMVPNPVLRVASQKDPNLVAGLVIDSNIEAASPFLGSSVGGVSSSPPTPPLLPALDASSSTPWLGLRSTSPLRSSSP